jgi:hypothetical protein
MRQHWALIGIAALVFGTGCKSKAEADVAASASAHAEGNSEGAANVQARIGGTVIAAGDYAVEVLLRANGAVEALVMDAKGELVADPGKVKLALTAQAKGGVRSKIDLAWDPVRARFVGKADAGVELVPGTVDVSLDVDGKASAGAKADVALAVEAAHGGQVIMVGDYSVELVSNAGFVQAFVFDASGKAHAAGDLDLKLDIGGKAVALVWDAASLSYKAKLDAGVDINAKPIALKLTAGGKVAVGAVQSFKADVNAAANLAADAKAKLAADANAKIGATVNVKAPDVSAQVNAANKAVADAKASIKAPSVNLSVKKTASASATAGTGAKASGSTGLSIGGK